MDEPDDLMQALIDLFQEAGRAHHRAFADTDGADPEWPIWYAAYLHERLCNLLHARFTQSELVYLMVLASKEQSSRAPGTDWMRYYARFFLERYT